MALERFCGRLALKITGKINLFPVLVFSSKIYVNFTSSFLDTSRKNGRITRDCKTAFFYFQRGANSRSSEFINSFRNRAKYIYQWLCIPVTLLNPLALVRQDLFFR